MNRTMLSIVMFAVIVGAFPAKAQVACATLPSLEACIECGAAKYGRDQQTAYCRNHWKPGRKAQSYERYRKSHPECTSSGCPISK
jgi:hypothetical protein